MRTVVLGANGRLGRMLRTVWTGDNTIWQARSADPGFVHLDPLGDADGLVRLLQGADSVICLLGVPPGRDRPTDDNVTLARATLDAARAASAGRVLLASSAAIYGRTPGPLTEDLMPAPVSAYGRSKSRMEAMAKDHDHPSTCLRIANVAGADSILGGWRPGFALDVLPDGSSPRRSYIGPTALAHVLLTLRRSAGLPAILNVAQPGAVAMADLLSTASLDWSPRPATADTIADVTLDTARLTAFVDLPAADPVTLVADWRRVGAAH